MLFCLFVFFFFFFFEMYFIYLYCPLHVVLDLEGA